MAGIGRRSFLRGLALVVAAVPAVAKAAEPETMALPAPGSWLPDVPYDLSRPIWAINARPYRVQWAAINAATDWSPA